MSDTFNPGDGWEPVDVTDPTNSVYQLALYGVRGELIAAWVREAPAPALPTEPGYYLTTEPDYGGGPVVVELLNSPAGQWVDAGDRQYLNEAQVRDMLPFVRLEPRAVTAQAVLDRVAEITAPENVLTGGAYRKVAREFGVDQ